jgi:hypothetical protein
MLFKLNVKLSMRTGTANGEKLSTRDGSIGTQTRPAATEEDIEFVRPVENAK